MVSVSAILRGVTIDNFDNSAPSGGAQKNRLTAVNFVLLVLRKVCYQLPRGINDVSHHSTVVIVFADEIARV